MKLFDDNKYRISHQVCERIKHRCNRSIERDRQETKRIANVSIKKFIKN
jgi:hypothetical protein